MVKCLINNKALIKDEVFKDISIEVNGDLMEAGLTGKYLANVTITKKNSNKKCEKIFLCSVTKKIKNAKEEIYHIFINHLEPEEILMELAD